MRSAGVPLSLLCACWVAHAAPARDAVTDSLALARQLVTAHPRSADILSIGTSRGGAPIDCLRISRDLSVVSVQPALLIVGGLDGSRPGTVTIAVECAKRLLADPEKLGGVTLLVIPCANPDAFQSTAVQAQGLALRNARPVDEDRDGRVDEDAPCDINGDGVITMMRRLHPPAETPPTHLPDPADPRLLRTPDPARNIRATCTLHVEGLDKDGDLLVAEDSVGGVDVDRNFPHMWKEFDRSAGDMPLSEPESLALARFVTDRPNIFAALVLGRCDNLIRIPDHKPRESSGRFPAFLEEADRPLLEELARRWLAASGQKRSSDFDWGGSLALWLYAHRGILSIATQAWGCPDAPPLPEGTPPPPSDAPKPQDEEGAQWLLWMDRSAQEGAFIPWKPFDHPTLGPVEIGGFAPRARSEPPAAELPRLGAAAADFAAQLIAGCPKPRLTNIRVRTLAAGLTEIEAEIVNEGWLPTAPAMGRNSKRANPVVVSLSLSKAQVQSGQRVTIVDGLEGAGGRRSLRWIVQTSRGEPIHIDLRWRPQQTLRTTVIDGAVTVQDEVLP